MKKITKLNIIMWVSLVLLIGGVLIISKLTEDLIYLLILVPFAVTGIVCEKLIEKEKQIENKNDRENDKKEMISLLLKKQGESALLDLIYEIVSGNCIEINNVIKDKDLIIGFDYVEEDNYYEVSIEKEKYSKKLFYYASLCSEGEILLNESEDGINVEGMNREDIIEILVEDVKKYAKRIGM